MEPEKDPVDHWPQLEPFLKEVISEVCAHEGALTNFMIAHRLGCRLHNDSPVFAGILGARPARMCVSDVTVFYGPPPRKAAGCAGTSGGRTVWCTIKRPGKARRQAIVFYKLYACPLE